MRFLITGAASGIGLALGERLAAAGHDVIGWDLCWQAPDLTHVSVDVCDEAAVAGAAEMLPKQLDAVVACAGIGSRTALLDTPISEFRRVIDVNLVGTAIVAQSVHSRLIGGVFVAVGSVAASVPMARRGAYSASKAAVVMLAKVLASEWAVDDIQVLCVSPGFVDTGMAVRGAAQGGTDLGRVLDRTPGGQLVPPDTLIDVLELAAGGGLPGVVGGEIVVDNGFVAGTTV